MKPDINELINEYIKKCSMPFNTNDHFEEIDDIRKQINEHLDCLYEHSKKQSFEVFFERYKSNKENYKTVDNLQTECDNVYKIIDGPADYYAMQEMKMDIDFWNIINKKNNHQTVKVRF